MTERIGHGIAYLRTLRAPLCVREALLQLVRRPLRSFLILQTVMWGSALAIFPKALYTGTRHTAFTKAGELAVDRVIVLALHGPVCTSWEELADLRGAVPGLEALTGCAIQVRQKWTLMGTDAENLTARRHVLQEGNTFSQEELASGAPVCVLEARAAEALFPEGAVGKRVRFSDGSYLTVVGVLRKRPEQILKTDELGFDKTHSLHFLAQSILTEMGVIPPKVHYLTAEKCLLVPYRYLGKPPVCLVARVDPERLRDACSALRRFFAERGRDVMVYANVVAAALLGPELKQFVALSRDIFLVCLSAGVAVVAICMLLSVNARRREIAIRRCEGATGVSVALQFLAEGAIFTTCGGIAGIPLGIVLAWIRASVSPAALLSWAIPWHEVWLTLLWVFAGGCVASVAPAVRAARLEVVEVLARG